METPQTVLYYDLVLEVWGASMDPECGAQTRTVDCIVLGELSRFLVLMRAFGVLPMVPLEILPMVPLVANGTIGSQWYHWLTIGNNGTIGRANDTIGITIGNNGITNGTIGRTLNDIGIPLVPLVEP